MHELMYDFIKNLDISKNISSKDEMYAVGGEHHYFYVGMSDILAIFNAVNIGLAYPGGDRPIRNILDFGCGHGRVTRYLRAAFPKAKITVTDLDQTGTRWCAKNYDCHVLEGPPPDDMFDLIWLGSVFTHLPEQDSERLLFRFSKSVRTTGILIFTTQGRFSIERLEKILTGEVQDRLFARYGLDYSLAKQVIAGYRSRGYGYVDYPHQTNYGVCCAEPTWYSRIMLSSQQFTQILLQEKGADNHQDVLAFMRVPLLDEKKGSLW